ncbi:MULTISPECIES: cupin domain-containing protein [unclassified Lactococcus]|uniref:cupin domain-containing protein n=1 Tax=unclassified Lactococcus TaxID=2643510 RepID=UPI0011C6EC50|nr:MULTISPECIES: cupin domain-containing protein [unclassified Lactococcus]MQW23648.1 cupin domain-containing protein [Lactococcus sp. dk101]TXK37617.1 cupin domain-containing protein [Lactococcus sp. dk310]TXK49055.1 cupin domain-containing protein [Lactococcus sp. dk322]
MTEDKKIPALFGQGEKNEAYDAFFIGQSYLNHLVEPHENIDFTLANVTFEAGCRNNWHVHQDGYQILLVTDGEGWYQEWGKPARAIKAGDVIVTHEGVKHWHGASRTKSMSHIAITKGASQFFEAVDEATYPK